MDYIVRLDWRTILEVVSSPATLSARFGWAGGRVNKHFVS